VLHCVVGEEDADLVPTQHAVAGSARVGNGNGRGEAVGVGVVGEDQLRPGLRGQGEHPLHGARLLRVREADGGEGPVGVALRRYRGYAFEAGSGQGADDQGVPHPVERGVGDPQGRRLRGVQRTPGEAVEVGVLDRAVRRVHEASEPGRGGAWRRGASDRAESRCTIDGRPDRGIDGRGDLGPASEVHLVAVVLRGVVAGGHHDPGRGAEVGHREGN
jgi:hypothetical protein